MAYNTHIEWTDATWNPVTGCSVVSPGCTNCYAMRLAGTRLKHIPSRVNLTTNTKAGPVWTGEARFNEEWLDQPLKWEMPQRIFVCADGDLFHENVPDEWLHKIFDVMARSARHTFQVLTKRSARMRDFCSKLNAPLPNVWLGVSVENQTMANERIPDLLSTPARLRFLSLEPLLSPIDLGFIIWPGTNGCAIDVLAGRCRTEIEGDLMAGLHISAWKNKIDWIIVGGESGPKARPMHPDWVLWLRDDCVEAGIPFFFKQYGAWITQIDRDVDDPDNRKFYGSLSAKPGRQFLNLNGQNTIHGPRVHLMHRVGKEIAGAKLDGREWNEYPKIS